MTQITLRPYQEQAIASVREAYRKHRRVLLVAPTGFGKTATASALIQWAVAKGRRVTFVVHRREIVMDTARRAGYPAQSTSIPGVAQRTGATTYYIEILPVRLAELNGQQPVFSLNPVPGSLDALVSTELLETARQISLGLVSADRTRVFSSSSRSLTTLERMPMGDGRLDTQPLLDLVKQ
ncbi:MAG: DEAD/DEAH box helicase, partial [Betaproteobacteria bacterium]|nr:DEAD/DEAH box helicase [Betaproteobacteria bacterium]